MAPRLVYFDTNIYRPKTPAAEGLTVEDIEKTRKASDNGQIEVLFSPSIMDEFAEKAPKDPAATKDLFMMSRDICSVRIPKVPLKILEEEIEQADHGERSAAVDWQMGRHDRDEFTRHWRQMADDPNLYAKDLAAHAELRRALKVKWKQTVARSKDGNPVPEELRGTHQFLEMRRQICAPSGLAGDVLQQSFGVTRSQAERILKSRWSFPAVWTYFSVLAGFLHDYLVGENRHGWGDHNDSVHHGPLIAYVDVFVTLDERFRRVLGYIGDLGVEVTDLDGFRRLL